ncbi:MAG: glycosyltransferase family 39 protein [Thermodesulfobacteriota bacterium]
MTPSRRILLLALAGGCLLRAALFALVAASPDLLVAADQKMYVVLAGHLAGHLDFGPGFGAERTPLYPLFLALCGVGSGGSLLAAIVVQNLLGGLAVYAVWRMGRLWSETAGNLAGAFAALSLNLAVYANQTLTEALFIPLFAWGLFLLFRHALQSRARDLAGCALAFGLCTLVRSATMYLPLFAAPYLLLRPGGGAARSRLAATALFCGLFGLVLAPWLARNAALYGHAGLTSQGAPHLIGWIVPAVAQYEEGLSQQQAMAKYTGLWEERRAALPPEVRDNPFAQDAAAKAFAADYLRAASPVSVAKAWFWGAAKNLFTPVSVELAYILKMDWTRFSETPGAGFPEQAWNFLAHNKSRTYVLFLLAGVGVTLLLRLTQLFGLGPLWRKPAAFWAAAMVVAYVLAVSGPVGYAKYRLPFEPVLCLLAGLAASRLPLWRRAGEGA